MQDLTAPDQGVDLARFFPRARTHTEMVRELERKMAALEIPTDGEIEPIPSPQAHSHRRG